MDHSAPHSGPKNREAGLALLQLAFGERRPDMREVQALLAANPDLEVSRPNQESILLGAIIHNHSDLVSELLAHGANVNPVFTGTMPLLHSTCMLGRSEMVAKLIAHGARLNDYDEQTGISALHFSLVSDYTAMFGEDDGRTARDGDDAQSSEERAFASEQSQKTVQLLLDSGAFVDDDMPGYSLVADHIKRANEAAKRVFASSPVDVTTLSASDVCFCANLGREKELFNPSLWHDHPARLRQLLSELPPYLPEAMTGHYPALSEICAAPAPCVEGWTIEYAPAIAQTIRA